MLMPKFHFGKGGRSKTFQQIFLPFVPFSGRTVDFSPREYDVFHYVAAYRYIVMLRRVIMNDLAPINEQRLRHSKRKGPCSGLPAASNVICRHNRARWRFVRPTVYRTFRVAQTTHDP